MCFESLHLLSYPLFSFLGREREIKIYQSNPIQRISSEQKSRKCKHKKATCLNLESATEGPNLLAQKLKALSGVVVNGKGKLEAQTW